MMIDNYKINNIIGEGNFGVILDGICQTTGKKVAIKIEKELDSKKSILRHEAQILLSLKGCNGIPQIIKYGLYDNHRYLIIPLLNYSLSDKIKKDGLLNPLDGLVIRNKIKEILNNIHKKGFIHRDIKPDNIMFDDNNQVYIIDFGCATRYIKSSINKTSSGNYVGTFEFLGEKGRKGYICKDVDFESLDKTIEKCI